MDKSRPHARWERFVTTKGKGEEDVEGHAIEGRASEGRKVSMVASSRHVLKLGASPSLAETAVDVM